MPKGLKTTIWIVVIILVVWGIYALSSTDKPSINEPVKIGVIGPITGEGALWGNLAQRSIEIAIEDINADRSENNKFQLIVEDSASETKDAISAASKLINVDKVNFLMPTYSSEVISIAPLANQNKIVMMVGLGSAPSISEAGEYVFRTKPSDKLLIKGLAKYAEEKGYENIGLISEKQEYSQVYADIFVENFNGEVTRKDYQTSQRDFKTIITALKTSDVDALLLIPNSKETLKIILKQLVELNWDTPIISNEIIKGNLDTLKESSEFFESKEIVYPSFVSLENEKTKEFVGKYKEKYGEEPPFEHYAITTYDAITVLDKTVEKVGIDGEKVKDYLNNNSFKSTFGYDIEFDENGDVKEWEYQFYKFNGTDFITLDSDE